MAQVESLRMHLIEELADLLDAEEQLTEALPKMAQSASARLLRAAFQSHLKQTEGHVARLKRALEQLDQSPKSKTCEGMKGLLEEGETMMNDSPEGPLRDAVMITAAQKVEHYEMASYGTARTYAEVLGERGVARLLEQTLKEEKAADLKLTQIAEGSVNRAAARQWVEQSEGEGLLQRAASAIGLGGRRRGSNGRAAADRGRRTPSGRQSTARGSASSKKAGRTARKK